MKVIGRFALALLLGWVLIQPSVGAEDVRIEVVQLQHRPAEEIIPVIAAVVGPTARVSSYGMKLILKAGPTQIAEARRIIEELDVERRNLVLRLLLRGEEDNVGGVGSSSVTVVLGGRSVFDPRRPVHGKEKRVVASGEGLAEERDTVETIRVEEGTPAYVRIGETRVLPRDRAGAGVTRPVVRIGTGADGEIGSGVAEVLVGWGGHSHYSTEPLLIRNTGVELVIVATLLGDDRVRIELARVIGNEESADPLAVPTTRTRTAITGDLGQWLTVATLSRAGVSRIGQGGQDTAATGQESRLLRIRADLAD